MKKLLFALFLLITTWVQAFPVLKMTAPVTFLALGESTTITFNFADSTTGNPIAVTNFILADANIKGDAIWTSGLSGSGSTYNATLQKTVTKNAVSIVVDNKSFEAAGVLGSGNAIGLNPAPPVYIKDGNSFTGKLIVADPQPRCALPGEFLADAAGNPASRVNEDYYILAKVRYGLIHQRIVSGCLTRLIGGLQFKLKPSPPNYEAVNPHGHMSHDKLMPKATLNLIKPLQGTTKFMIAPSNAEYCTLNGNLEVVCSGRTPYNGVNVHSTVGGDSRFSTVASKFLTDDPIIYPGVRGAAHLHIFYGNNAADYTTNNATIKTACNSLFAGGRMNCTGYWTPAVIDTATNNALVPSGVNVYYKADASPTEPVRAGLRIIAGNPAANGAGQRKDDTRFECTRRSDGVVETHQHAFPSCDGNKYRDINLFVAFPKCVADDGFGNQKLDSPDHRSHLIPFGVSDVGIVGTLMPNGCTTLFPHAISHITQNVHYDILPGQNTATWRLSSDNYPSATTGGYSLHADWMNGWDQASIEQLVRDCNNTGFNCGQNYRGMSAGIGVVNVTTTANKAVITTQNPHKLEISNSDGTYPNMKAPSTEPALLARIDGFTGTDAAAYNFDINKVSAISSQTGLKTIMPSGVQRIKILNPTQIEYTLNYTPTTPINGAVNPANVRIKWGEYACNYNDTRCNPEYNEFYYGNN